MLTKTLRNEADMFTTTERLLENYPQFQFCEGNEDRCFIWKDLLKSKMRRISDDDVMELDEDSFLPEYHKELVRLLVARNHMKHIVTVISAKKNKKVIFQVMGELMGDRFVLGGEMAPKTLRINHLYEQEGMHIIRMLFKYHCSINHHIFSGGVKPIKRKSFIEREAMTAAPKKINTNHGNSLSSSVDSDNSNVSRDDRLTAVSQVMNDHLPDTVVTAADCVDNKKRKLTNAQELETIMSEEFPAILFQVVNTTEGEKLPNSPVTIISSSQSICQKKTNNNKRSKSIQSTATNMVVPNSALNLICSSYGNSDLEVLPTTIF